MQDDKSKGQVVSYYNEHVQHKLNDYIKVNPRIEEAWATLINFAPRHPTRILEVGCGIGSISARMQKYWPSAKVTGIDISSLSIQIAKKLFEKGNLNFFESILLPETFSEEFDLIVFMDVYEHIAIEDRPSVQQALKKILSNQGRVFLSVPTPHNLKWSLKHKPETMQPVDEHISFSIIGELAHNLKWSLKHKPETMQPVDEHISFSIIGELAQSTETEVLLYQIKNIWNTGDYAHVVLERNNDFEAPFFYPKPVTTIQRSARILRKAKNRLGSFIRKINVRRKLD